MSRPVRLLLVVVALVQAVFALLLVVQPPSLVSLWPLPDTTPLTFIFIGSIAAAASASTAWCALLRVRPGLVGIALDYIVICLPLTVFTLQASAWVGSATLVLAAVCVLGLVFGLWLLRYGLGEKVTDPRPCPLIVRVSFGVFVVALVLVGGSMVLKTPNVIPWRVTEDGSVVIGWIFLGAAAYFLYGLLRPSWSNAGGQLAGFLAYDLVLIVPFLQRLPTVSDEFRNSLIVYTIILVYSGILAAYYLFLHPSTRIWGELRAGLRHW